MVLADRLIDLASKWIEAKDASYLCKEDEVVWFASITGRDTDKQWHTMNLTQLQRVMKYTIQEHMDIKSIISAFQELDRVYEMGANSEFQTPSSIFNFNDNSPMDLPEKLIRELANFLSNQGTKGMRIIDLNLCFDTMCVLAGTDTSNQKRNKHYEKYFGILGYALRAGKNRVSINGRKVTAILHNNYGPSMIAKPDKAYLKNIASLVVSRVEK